MFVVETRPVEEKKSLGKVWMHEDGTLIKCHHTMDHLLLVAGALSFFARYFFMEKAPDHILFRYSRIFVLLFVFFRL